MRPAKPTIVVNKTQDGTVIVFDSETKKSASGRDVNEALHELRRLVGEAA